MSADENISVSIQDSEIDAAIQKLNAALTKKEQLTNAVNGSPQGYSGERDSGVIINSSVEAEFAKIDVAQKQLSDFQNTTDSATSKVKTLLAGEGREIKGVESSANRIIRMIPGLREANRLQRSIRQLSDRNIVGAVGLFMLAIRIYRMIDQYYKKLEQEKQDYQRQIMEIRGYTRESEYNEWLSLQKDYRSRPIF